jgi:hypothetical protein
MTLTPRKDRSLLVLAMILSRAVRFWVLGGSVLSKEP